MAHLPRHRRGSLLPPATLWLVSAAYLVIAYGFPPEARMVPVLIGWAMLVLSGLDLASRLPVPFAGTLARALNPSLLQPELPDISAARGGRQVVAILAVLALSLGLLLLGVLIAVPLFVLPALRFGAERRWGTSILGAAGMALLMWAVFAKLLGLDLYPGLLFHGGW